jgi:chromosome partitioning protein
MSALVTALVSHKGGVGKTTTAVNLAAALAATGRRTLLVDVDPNASASLSMGVPRHRLAPSSADLMIRDLEPHKAVRRTSTGGLDLISGSVDLVSIEVDLNGLRFQERVLVRAIEPLRERFDQIFIDCPPGLGLLSRNALVAADRFVIPAIPQYLAVEGIQQLIAAVERLDYRCETRTRLIGVVLTMADYRTRATRETVTEIRRELEDRVFGVEIRTNVRLAEAPKAGKTIFAHDPHSTGAQAYRLLAEEFILRTTPSREVAQRMEEHLVEAGILAG